MTGTAASRQAGAFGRKAAHRHIVGEPVLDADFITLPADHAASPTHAPRQAAKPEENRAAPGMALFDADGLPRDKPQADDRVAFFGFSVLLVLFAFWVSGGHALSDRLVATLRAPVASQGIVLDRVAWRIEEGVAGPSLLVDGFLRNDGARLSALSPVSVVVRRSDGHVTQFRINPGTGALAPGELLGINARLDLSATASVRGTAAVLDRQAAAIETVAVTLLP
jgi:hypothetical protein